MKTIFDIGANVGDNIAYYLHKSDRVVAVEANPLLCEKIRSRFKKEILDENLFVMNCVLCSEADSVQPTARFYIHKEMHVLSRFPRPREQSVHKFDEVEISVKSVPDILDSFGVPYYLKVDVEHYDHVLLADFFRLGIFPEQISVEYHSQRVANLLLGRPEYVGFKIVDGPTVNEVYKSVELESRSGNKYIHEFPPHSAGPFGNDIHGPWYDRRSFARKLFAEGTGWKDIHASSVDAGVRVKVPLSSGERVRYFSQWFRSCIPESLKRVYRNARKLVLHFFYPCCFATSVFILIFPDRIS